MRDVEKPQIFKQIFNNEPCDPETTKKRMFRMFFQELIFISPFLYG